MGVSFAVLAYSSLDRGVKGGGCGREGGPEALDEYTEVENTMIDLSEAVRDPSLLGT